MNTDDTAAPLLSADRLSKSFGHVVALADSGIELRAGEVLAVVGDNGAGKSTLIKCLTGALIPDTGTLRIGGERAHFKGPSDARAAGIETVYQNLAVAPALDIASNLFLGRELYRKGFAGRVFRSMDKPRMRREAEEHIKGLGVTTLQRIDQAVETLSGGQRQCVAVARAAAFGSRIVILDEPTAALGVRESAQVVQLIKDLRTKGMAIIVISHDMPMVFDVADRIQVQRLGRTAAVINNEDATTEDIIAYMTGAKTATEGENR